MDKKGFNFLFTAIKATYPNFNILSTDEAADLWFMMLKDIYYNVAENAILEHISSSQYPPPALPKSENYVLTGV